MKTYTDISHLHVLLTVDLKDILLNSLHGKAGKEPGISEMIQQLSQNYYFPSIANHVREWVKNCQIWVAVERMDNSQITPDTSVYLNGF